MTNEIHETDETRPADATVETTAAEATSAPQGEPHTSDPRVERTVEAAGAIVEAAVDIGRTWAGYGLRVGKLALETHAHTMGKLASALGELNRAFEPREAETARPEREPETLASDAPHAA